MSRLREMRTGAGLTQEELARKAGLTLSALCQVETGRREPRLKTAQAIAKALGVPTDLIWPITPDESTPADVRSPA